MTQNREQGGIWFLSVKCFTHGKQRLRRQVMCERRVLKFALHLEQPHGLRDIARVGVHETNILIRANVFSHFRCELQVKGYIQVPVVREFIVVGDRGS